jgi:hypothetical protein
VKFPLNFNQEDILSLEYVCVAKVYPNCSFNILPNYVSNLLLFWLGHSSISNFYSESVTMSRIPWKVTDELKPKYFP